MSDVTVREIRPSDHDRVGALLVASYDAVGPFSEPYREFLADPEEWVPGTTATWVAEHDGVVVGAVGFVLPGDEEFETFEPPVGDCGFRFLSVAPDAQGRGAGGALVDRCVREARSRGCRRMMIHSMEFMTTAHRLYERRGFDRRRDLDVTFPSGVGYGYTLDLTDDAARHFPPPGPVPSEPPWYEQVLVFLGDEAAETEIRAEAPPIC